MLDWRDEAKTSALIKTARHAAEAWTDMSATESLAD